MLIIAFALCLAILIGYIVLSQVILPAFNGKPLFYSFRTNESTELVQKVEATQQLVDAMKNQNASLTTLQRLLLERAALEKKINLFENPTANKE